MSKVQVPLRWLDMDVQKHVNNTVLVDLMQEARTSQITGSEYAYMVDQGMVLVEHKIEYLRPVVFDREPLDVDVTTSRVRAATFEYNFVCRQFGEVVLRAVTTMCLFDFEAQRPRRIAGDEMGYLRSLEGEGPLEMRQLGRFELGPTPFVHPVRARWSDQDKYGHVNNVHFVDFFNEARVALHEAVGSKAVPNATSLDTEGGVMIVRQDIRYVNQMAYRLEPYEVHTSIAKLGQTSLTLAHAITDPLDGRILATGSSVMVCVDDQGQPTPVNAELVTAAQRWPGVCTEK